MHSNLSAKFRLGTSAALEKVGYLSYLALGQIRKLGNLGKIFLSFRNDLNFASNCDLQWKELFLCFSKLFPRKRVKLG